MPTNTPAAAPAHRTDSRRLGVEVEIARDFGTVDGKGRAVGSAVCTFVEVYETLPASASSYYTTAPGTYFAFYASSTRDGACFGAGQRVHLFEGEGDRDAAVEAYFAKAAKRAQKRFALAEVAAMVETDRIKDEIEDAARDEWVAERTEAAEAEVEAAPVAATTPPSPRAGNYTDAPACRLLAANCLICGRELLDAVSVEVGIGPVCRGRVDLDAATIAARPEVNALVHEAALDATPVDRRIEIADAVRALGFEALADRILSRFLAKATVAVRLAHGVEVAPSVTITEGRAHFGGNGAAEALFVAFATYRADAVDGLKAAVHWHDRRWDNAAKAWAVRPSCRAAVFVVLRATMAGEIGLGPRGRFVIPPPATTPPTAPPATTPPTAPPATDAHRDAAVAVDKALDAGARLYQAKGVHWLATHGMEANGALLADDMGLGKTMQAILALPLRGARALVVAPKVLLRNWAREVGLWRPDLVAVVVTGKTWRLPAAGEVVICNYEALPARLAVTDPGSRWSRPDLTTDEARALAATVLIIDEAEAVTNWKAQRTARIRNLRFGARAAWALTGTPMPARPMQLWGLLATLGVAKGAFGSFDRFVGMMGGRAKRFGGYEFDARRADSEAVALALRGVMLRRTKATALPELPSKIRVEVTVATPRALSRALDAAFASWPEAARGEMPDFTHFSVVRQQLAASRIEAMLDRVNVAELQGEALVVYSAHRAPIEALAARPGWGVVIGGMASAEVERVVDAFQAGALKGIGITTAGARGLTLTRASRMLLVDLPWNPSEVDQVEDRICRIGQVAEGLVYERMVSDHPLDLHVLALLDSKRALVAASVDVAAVAPSGPSSHVEAR